MIKVKIELLNDFYTLVITFPEPNKSKEWIRNPFSATYVIESFGLSARMCDQLIELGSDGALKITFSEKSLTNFWIHVKSEYPELANSAIKHLLSFPTTYNCEIGFSALIGLKSVKRNRLNVEPDLRLKLSSIAPDVAKLVKDCKQHHYSH
jgi:hypothetical protein